MAEVTEILPVDAFQISVYTDAKGTDYSTHRATDGNDHTFMLTNRWVASRENVLSRCHTKRRTGVHGRTRPSFGMAPTFQKKKNK